MDTEKPKFGLRNMLITTGIVLITALVVGGATWYVMEKSSRDIKAANDRSVAALQKQIDELKIATTTSATTTTADPTSDWKTYTSNKLKLSFKYPTNKKVIDCTYDNPMLTQYLWLADASSTGKCDTVRPDGLFSITGFIEKATDEQNYTRLKSNPDFLEKSILIGGIKARQVSFKNNLLNDVGNEDSGTIRSMTESSVFRENTKVTIFQTGFVETAKDTSRITKSYLDTYNLIISTVKFL